MVSFKALLQKFGDKGEKTGWTYFSVPKKTAEKLKPGNKKSFRVKGSLDDHEIKAVALIPIGEGNFILAVNATMRKAIKKIHGATIQVRLEEDEVPLKISGDLAACFKDDPVAFKYFKSLPVSHQNWYSNWVKAAKTSVTKSKRIAAVISACSLYMTFREMMHKYRDDRSLLAG